jgi:hypothetical protein
VAEAPVAVSEGAPDALCCEAVSEVELVALGEAQGEGVTGCEAESKEGKGAAEGLGEGECKAVTRALELAAKEAEGGAVCVAAEGESGAVA